MNKQQLFFKKEDTHAHEHFLMSVNLQLSQTLQINVLKFIKKKSKG